MGISSRIEGTIESWRIKWGETLKSWLVSFLSIGLDAFFRVLGNSFAPKLKPLLDSIEEKVTVPPELKPLFDEIRSPTGEIGAILAQSAGGALVGGAIGSVIDAMFLRFAYSINEKFHPKLLTEAQFTTLWRRGNILADELTPYLRKLGLDDISILGLQQLSEARLDPMSAITAWRRDPEKYAKFLKDLFDQGFDAERMEVLKFVTQFIPTADEQTHWLAREVYEPEMVSRYGLDSELPNYEETDFSKVGVTPEQMKNKWMAHWEHASYMQVREMLRRGFLSLDKTMPEAPTTQAGWETRDAEGVKAMYDWYRLVEIPPFWRARLTEMVFEVPTRVDVRRFWDMRTIDEERLRSIYHAQGYHGKDLDDYVLWTKVYVAFPDLIARYKNGWITEDVVRSELTALGMSPERLQEMWETKFKTAAPERVAAEKTATATEIMKAVKKELISRSEGIERLGRMGYSPEEAEFKLDVYIGVAEGSPETYMEFVEMTEKYRKAMGLESQVPPADLVEAGKETKRAEIALRDAESQEKAVEELALYLKTLSDAKYRYRALLVSWEESKKK